MNKSNKIIIKALLILCSITPSYSMGDSLYTGINIGKSSINADLKRDIPGSRNDHAEMGNNEIGAGIFIGYNHLIKDTPVIAGIELGVQNHNLEVLKRDNSPFFNQIAKIRTNNSFTGVLKIGISIKDIMIYGKAGLALTNWTLSFTSDLVNRPQGNWNTNISKKSNKYGAILGCGIDFRLNPNWAIGIDHTVTQYPSLKLHHPMWALETKPLIQTTSLRLMYIF